MKTSLTRVLAPLTALAAMAALTACGGGSEGASSGSVTVWMYPVISDPKANTAYWEAVEKDFEAANSDTDLKIEQQPWDNRDQKLATAFSGGKGPDVLLLGPDQIPQFVTSGSLAPVDKAIEGTKDKFLPGSLDALSVGGKIYGVPIYHTVTSTMYNKALLDKAGIKTPPQTWDEVKAAAPKLKAIGVATLDYSASPETSLNQTYYPLLWQAGGKVFSEDGKKSAFNSPEGLEALTFLTDLFQAGSVPKSALTNKNQIAEQAMGKQQVAMGFANVPADAKLAAASWGAGNVVIGEPLKHQKQVGFGLPGGLAMNEGSENTAGAEKFMKFMTEPAQLTSLAKASGFLSPRTDVKVPISDPLTAKFAEALPFVYSGEPNPSARQVMSLLSAEIQAALTGKKTPKDALESAAKQADDLLSRQR
jgi:multiple sugar transport system substrate-binding protein